MIALSAVVRGPVAGSAAARKPNTGELIAKGMERRSKLAMPRQRALVRKTNKQSFGGFRTDLT